MSKPRTYKFAGYSGEEWPATSIAKRSFDTLCMPCPRCGAKPREPCRSAVREGEHNVNVHGERRRDWLRFIGRR